MLELFAVRGQLAITVFVYAALAATTFTATLFAAIAARQSSDAEASHWWARVRVLAPLGTIAGTLVVAQLGLFWSEALAVGGAALVVPLVLAIVAGLGRTVLVTSAHEPDTRRIYAALGLGLQGGVAAILGLAWLSNPHGATIATERALEASAVAAFLSPSGWMRVLHMGLGAVVVGSSFFAVGAARRHDPTTMQRTSTTLLAALTLQALVGVATVRTVGNHEPVKLAAMVAQWDDRAPAPLEVASWPFDFAEQSIEGVRLEGVLSRWIHGDPDAEVEGLLATPMESRPPVAALYVAFQAKLVLATWAWLTAAVALIRTRRGGRPRWWLALTTLPTVLALWTLGWAISELGRSPWTIRGALRVGDATWLPYGMAPSALAWVAAAFVLLVVAAWRCRRLPSPRGSTEPSADGNV